MFSRGELASCTEALSLGLSVSPARPDEWFILGMIAMNEQRFPAALKVPVQHVPAICLLAPLTAVMFHC